MKRLPLLLATLLLCAMTHAMAQSRLTLSPTASASILTCGPGDEFYLAFGHTALRICDTAQDIDRVYNYGTFDFNTPHFYLKFAQGQLNYCLSRTTMEHFLAEYAFEGRLVIEQRLNLTPQELNNLYVMLEWNYLPENRYYRYDFFRDNCATRVRDMAENALVHRQVAYRDEDLGFSYRDGLRLFEGPDRQWWTLGVDLLLGARCDRKCSAREFCYLPLPMSDVMAEATADGQPLTDSKTLLLASTRHDGKRSFPPLAAGCALLVAVIGLTAAGHRQGWSLRWMDRGLYIIAGLAGLFLLFMWVGTSHWCTKWNLNLLWLSPLFLIYAIRMEQGPKWTLWLMIASVLAGVLVSLFGWPQRIPMAAIPVMAAYLVRLWDGLKRRGLN